jgi:hypothetical protein
MYLDLDVYAAMLRAAHDPRDFSPTRTFFADLLLGLISACGGATRLGERVDELRYPEHLDYPLGKPIYIVAAPRSGTTFLHRMMAQDPQFATFKLYQTFFPSITLNEIAAHLTRPESLLSGSLQRIRHWIDESSFGGWTGLHDMGLSQDEEDEALWALSLTTPAILLVLPDFEKFGALRYLDRFPAHKRDKLVAHYRGCVQRHLFFNRGKTLLAKNVLLPGRLQIVRQAVPDARFVHIVRHPYEAIGSMMSLFTIPWRWHSPNLRLDGKEAHALAQLGIDYYRTMHRESVAPENVKARRFLNVRYQDLLSDPAQRVREIYEAFELTLGDEFAVTLRTEAEEQRNYKSEHRYSLEQFGLSRDYIFEELREVFEHYDFERTPDAQAALRTPRTNGLSPSPYL